MEFTTWKCDHKGCDLTVSSEDEALTMTEENTSAELYGDNVVIRSMAPGPYRDGPACIAIERKDATELADKLVALDVLKDARPDDSLFEVGSDAEGKTWALSAMRFRRYDEWWVQLNTRWNGKPNHGSVQFKAAEAVELSGEIRQALGRKETV